jgi:hypothetical protein
MVAYTTITVARLFPPSGAAGVRVSTKALDAVRRSPYRVIMPTEDDARVDKEIDQLFDELDDLLKSPDLLRVLTSRRVNASLAMLVADGLRAYLRGEKEKAIEDLTTASEEIAQRFAQASKGDA